MRVARDATLPRLGSSEEEIVPRVMVIPCYHRCLFADCQGSSVSFHRPGPGLICLAHNFILS